MCKRDVNKTGSVKTKTKTSKTLTSRTKTKTAFRKTKTKAMAVETWTDICRHKLFKAIAVYN